MTGPEMQWRRDELELGRRAANGLYQEADRPRYHIALRCYIARQDAGRDC